MEKSILIIFGMVLFINALFDKFGTWHKIALHGSRQRHKIIYSLANCQFCILFHCGWVFTVMYGFLYGFTWELLSTPFVVSGLVTLKNRNYDL